MVIYFSIFMSELLPHLSALPDNKNPLFQERTSMGEEERSLHSNEPREEAE
jgi:hypothetical protein